jgi:COMPASS component BRE2
VPPGFSCGPTAEPIPVGNRRTYFIVQPQLLCYPTSPPFSHLRPSLMQDSLTMSTQESPSKPEPIAVAAVASVPTSSIPQKRALEDDHLPTVSSPLNPDFKASKDDNPLARERTSRAKKESLKKRESKGGGLHAPDTSNRTTPDPKASTPKHKKSGNVLTPIRYKLPPPKITDFEAPRGPVFIPSHTKTAEGFEIHFNETTDQ